MLVTQILGDIETLRHQDEVCMEMHTSLVKSSTKSMRLALEKHEQNEVSTKGLKLKLADIENNITKTIAALDRNIIRLKTGTPEAPPGFGAVPSRGEPPAAPASPAGAYHGPPYQAPVSQTGA